MNKKTFFISLKIVFVLFFASGSFYFCVENVESAEAKVEYIEYDDGSKLPVIQDPCQLKGTAKEEAVKYVKGYTNIGNEVNNGKTTIEEIKAKKFDDLNHLSTIIDLSLYNWACQNGYKLSNTQSLGPYFFKKDLKINQGIFIGIKADGYLSSHGVRKGNASLALDERGPYGDTYYLQVIITKLNPEPNEKIETGLNDAAQKILNTVVDFSYQWGLEYYSEMIEQAKKEGK